MFPGGYRGEETPVTIPNTEVKLPSADGTAGATLWESRSLPGFFCQVLTLTFSLNLPRMD